MSHGAAAAEHAEAPQRPTRRTAWSGRVEVRVLLCAGLVAAADWLFFDRTLGWSFGLYVAISLGALLVAQPRVLRRRAGVLLAVLVLGLAVASALHPTPQGVLLSGAGLVAIALVGRHGWARDVGVWIRRYTSFALWGIAQPFRDLGVARRWAVRGGSSTRTFRLLLWILPLALGAVFLGLFALANPVIQVWVESISTRLRSALGGLELVRLVFWCVVGAGAWALLRTRARFAMADAAREPRTGALLCPAMLVRCLLVFNAIFLVQNLLDLRFLMLGAALPEGMTYAGYAHRGAYPLIATALLAAGFVLLTFRAGQTAGPWARKLVYLWLVQNVVLTFAAATRLALYVEAYTLTRWRLAAAVWMGLVALGLVLIAVRIITNRSNRWLIRVNAFAAIAVVYACCFVSWPGFIATYNVQHSREVTGTGESIDLRYLRALGPSALPAWQRLASLPAEGPARAAAGERIPAIEESLRTTLTDWRAWTVRRVRLLERASTGP